MSASNQKTITPWPLLVAAIGLAFIGVTAWSIIQAHDKVSPVTDPAYYSHGLRYNQTSLEEQAAESYGWTIRTELADHRLNIFLTNGEPRAVTGCRGEMVLYDTGRDGIPSRLALSVKEEGNGLYRLELPSELTGSITADLSLQRDGASFNRRLLINL